MKEIIVQKLSKIIV